ncbi:MAG: hypothetical protein IJ721_03245 [Bacteroidales bacterium]|nr:hypothetical protein [Bacteroidales bacterium]
MVELTFTATISPETRTVLSDDYQVRWMDGDVVAFFSGTTKVTGTAAEVSADGLSAKFEVTLPESDTYYAVYPDSDNVTYDGTTLNAELYQYRPGTSGSFPNNSNLMVGKAAGGETHFQFHNLCGLVKIHVCSTDISQLQLKVLGGGVTSGRFTVDFDGEVPKIGTFTKEWTDTYIQRVLPGDYYIPIPPQSNKTGIQLTYTHYSGSPTSWFTTDKTFSLEAGHVLDLGVIGASYVFRGAASTKLYLSHVWENENVYAAKGTLKAGNYYIGYKTEESALVPASGHDIHDAAPSPYAEVTTNDVESQYWTIPADGTYRIVLDKGAQTVTIYSEANDLQPKVVEWSPNGAVANGTVTTIVGKVHAYGAGTSWGVKDMYLNPSVADPQVLILYSGDTKYAGLMKFCLTKSITLNGTSYNQNNSYCYSSPLTADSKRQNVTVTAGEWTSIEGGSDGEHRNSYMSIPSGTNVIIFDLRNMRIKATSK